MKRWLPILSWLVLLSVACGDDDPATSCTSDGDCRKIDDCCAGCYAANLSEVIEDCDAACIQSACAAAGKETHVAACKNAQCTLVDASN